MKIDHSKDSLIGEYGIKILRDRYLNKGEVSPQEAFARAATAFSDDAAHAQRLYDYASNLWFGFATPVLINGGTNKGLPISCYLNYVEDSREGITETYAESAFLASLGGGIGTSWSDVRSNGTPTSKGSESTGVIPFIKVQDSLNLAFSQGKTRRGSSAAYMDMYHPEIEEFLDVRKFTGDMNRRSTNLHHGVVIDDKFMNIIKNATQIKGYDDSWELVDPHTQEVVKTVRATTLWKKIIHNRLETGEPYIIFSDAANEALAEWQKELGLRIVQSNLCTEIFEVTDENRTAVCCLSSVNLEKFDEWKDHPKFIEDLMRMLDNILSYFIKKAPPQLYKAIYSAQRERSVGLGAMGFHAYLQNLGVPFESPMVRGINNKMFSRIKSEADKASKLLAKERGECIDAKGYGERFTNKIAIAPNASSSIYCGNTSPGVEPIRANVVTQKTMTGSYELRNPRLEKVLERYGQNTPETWNKIRSAEGSVQHLDFLTEIEKEVFKTAVEIDQKWVINHAADRQPYICQGQSINLFFPANVSKQELHDVHMLAWVKSLKSLYYLRSTSYRRAENVTNESVKYEFAFDKEDSCLACEG